MRQLLFVAACMTIAGCAAKRTGSATSAVSGTLTRATFPDEVRLVTATNEKGASISTAPDSDGAFRLVLRKGHTYKLAVSLAVGSVPIVFPRTSGKLDPSFRVSGGSALVDLGSVRYLTSAPALGFSMQALNQSIGADHATGSGPQCEDGIDIVTGGICIDDQGQVSCEENDGENDADEGEDHDGDGECEDGVDATTGAACAQDEEGADDADDLEEASPTGPMSIAEHNVPDKVGGCDDSNEEQEGEHED